MTQHLEEEIFGSEQRPAGHGGSAPPPRRTMQSFAALVVALSVIVGGGLAAYHFIGPAIDKFVATSDYPGPGTGSVDIEVAEGQSGAEIAETLADAGVVKTSQAFVDAAGREADLAKAIQPGTYTLKKEMTAQDALAWLADPSHRTAKRVTIPEGLWASDIYSRLSKASGIPVKDYQKAAKNTKALGLPAAAKGTVEGWLFPSTYEFPKTSTATDQLKMMVDQAVTVMKAEKIPESRWEKTMILASIVESEAGSSNDRRKVARVFLNRLDNPTAETVGLLQSDATVSYGVGKRAVAPTEAQKKDAGNPYNTHVHKGLPPGPISNPGTDSLNAASHPADGPWLYFVTVNPDTGETKFAETYAQQQVNQEEFFAWCRKNPDAKCFG